MNDLIRPALYQAYHPFYPMRESGPESGWTPADIVGPVCESTDQFATARALPALNPGDKLVIGAAGAYSAVMSSEYNGRPRAPEVMVRGSDWATVRRRPTYEEMLAAQTVPDWLSP